MFRSLRSVPKTLTLARDIAFHGGGGGWWAIRRGMAAVEGAEAGRESLSMWRRKKEMGKEGLMVVREMKRLHRSDGGGGGRLEGFLRTRVSRLLKSDLTSVLMELQRQDLVFLSMKIYEIVRKEIWYRPDMFFYRDMLIMLARNKRIEDTRQVWDDMKSEGVHFDQHFCGDIIRAYADAGLTEIAMEFYDEMRQSPDPPIFLPYRVILKGLIPYPELRERVTKDFLELFPHMIVFEPPKDLSTDEW